MPDDEGLSPNLLKTFSASAYRRRPNIKIPALSVCFHLYPTAEINLENNCDHFLEDGLERNDDDDVWGIFR